MGRLKNGPSPPPQKKHTQKKEEEKRKDEHNNKNKSKIEQMKKEKTTDHKQVSIKQSKETNLRLGSEPTRNIMLFFFVCVFNMFVYICVCFHGQHHLDVQLAIMHSAGVKHAIEHEEICFPRLPESLRIKCSSGSFPYSPHAIPNAVPVSRPFPGGTDFGF